MAARPRSQEELVRSDTTHCEVCLDGLRGDVKRPTMTQLTYFLHVSRTASFAAVAREFDVDPSTIRQVIDRLEHLVGLRLFERSPQRIMLTPPGRLLLPLAQRIVYLATVIGSVAEGHRS